MRAYLLLACSLITLATPCAEASFQLTFRSNYGGTATVVDNGVRDEDPMVGSIRVGGVGGTPLVLNGYTFRTHMAYAGQAGGINFISTGTLVTGWGAGSISILASMNDISTSQPQGMVSSNAAISFVTPLKVCNTATVEYGAYVDNLNRLSTQPQGTLVSAPASGYIDGNASTAAASVASFSDDTVVASNSLFAMNLYLRATGLMANVGNRLFFDGGLQFLPIPESSSGVIWSLLGGLALAWRRRIC
jgi:hypothetical protein